MTAPGSVPDRSRLITWSDPVPGARVAPTMTGLDFLRAMMRGELPPPPMAALMGMTIIEADHGRVVFEAEPAEYHYNPGGVVHGGFAATLLDSAMGCAVQAALPAGGGYTTVDMHVHFVRALLASTGRVRCEGTVVHAGSRILTAEGRIEDANGRLYAHGSETCLVLAERGSSRNG